MTQLNIDSQKIDAYLNQKNIQYKTKTVYKSVLENLEVFANTYPNDERAVILNRFLNQNISPKARMMYNSITNDYLNYIDRMDTQGSSVQVSQIVQVPDPVVQVPRVKKDKVPFVPEEIDFNRLCYFDSEGYKVNKKTEYFPVSDEMEIAELAFMSGTPFCIRGRAGTGKTSLAIKIAEKHDVPLVKVNCSDGLKSHHLIGSAGIDSKSGELKFQAGLVTEAVLLANKYGTAILMLDEINTLKPTVQKDLLAFLDDTKFTNVKGYGKLAVNEGAKLWIFGTMNLNYAGTNDLNTEFKSRLSMYEITNISKAMQTKILSKYAVSDMIRDGIITLTEKINYQQEIGNIDGQTVFSTREQLMALAMIESGMDNGLTEKQSLDMALKINFVQKVYEKKQQEEIQKIIGEIFFS